MVVAILVERFGRRVAAFKICPNFNTCFMQRYFSFIIVCFTQEIADGVYLLLANESGGLVVVFFVEDVGKAFSDLALSSIEVIFG